MSLPEDTLDPAEALDSNPFDAFPAESGSSSPAVQPSAGTPSAIDEFTRNLRSRAAGIVSTVQPKRALLRDRLAGCARYLRKHTPHLLGAAAVAAMVTAGVRWWPEVNETAGTLGSHLLSAVSLLGAPVALETESPVESPPAPSVRSRRVPRSVPDADVPAVPSSSPAAPPEQELIAARPAAELTLASVTPSAVPLAATEAVAFDTVYSSDDANVQPPQLRLEWRGESARNTGEGTRVLELLVGVDGDVEQVKLRSPAPRWLDPMLLSRAKMWQFEPAQLAGRAVPYRLVLMVPPSP